MKKSLTSGPVPLLGAIHVMSLEQESDGDGD